MERPHTTLNERRRQLRMSRAVLAERTRIPPATLGRILSGRHMDVALETVARVVAEMGLKLEVADDTVVFVPAADAAKLRERQAKRKAQAIVRQVQGTCALEAQGVDAKTLGRMVRRAERHLLDGSGRKLWAA